MNLKKIIISFLKMEGGKYMKKEKNVTIMLFAVYLAILTWIILFKMQFSFADLGHIRQINIIPFGESVIVNEEMYLDEIINNCIVFIPVGAYASLLMPGGPFWKKICPAFGISLAYEALQFIFAIGASDITDLLSNTAGGIVGAALVLLFSKVLKDRTHRLLNRAAIVCTILVAAFLVLLLVFNMS